MKTELKAYLVMSAVFVLGAVVGAAGTWRYAQHHYAELLRDEPPDVRESRRFGALVRELGLTPDQQQKIRVIMSRHIEQRRQAMRTMFEKCGGDFARTRADLDAQIRAVLTDAQRERFDRIIEQRRPFMGMGPGFEPGPGHGHGFGPGPGPGPGH